MALLHKKLFVFWLCATSSSERIGRKRKSSDLKSQHDEPKLHSPSEKHPSAFISTKDTQRVSTHFHDYVTAARDAFQPGRQREQETGRSNAEEGYRDKHFGSGGSVILSVLAYTGIVILALLAFIVVLLFLTPCWLGPAIKAAITGLDKKVLGVDILVESISVNPFSGRVQIKGFRVCNPSGYQSQYMLEMETLLLDLKMRTLLYTWMKAKFSKSPIHVIISQFIFVKFQAMVEKHSMYTSNVKQILDHVMESTKKKQKPKDDETPAEGASESATQETDNGNQTPKPKITLQEIKIQDIDVRFQVEGTIFGKHLESGCDITIADVNYHDFSDQHGALTVEDVALFVLESVLKMIVTNIAGKKIGNEWF